MAQFTDILRKLNLIKPKEEKNDDDQNFIKKDDVEVPTPEEENKSNVHPKKNQIRDLDNEVGGLEEKQEAEVTSDKTVEETVSKDSWDDRSEEVDEMGTSDVFNTTGMRSTLWKKKKSRLNDQKLEEENISHADRVQNREANTNNNGTSR